MIQYRESGDPDIITPPEMLERAMKKSGIDFDLYCEDMIQDGKPHWALDNFRLNGMNDGLPSYILYTQPSWGKYFIDRMGDRTKVKLITYAVDTQIYPLIHSEKIYDIGFIGNMTDNDGRKEYLDLLSSRYNCFFSHDVPTLDIAEKLSQCKVLFNHIRYEEINIRFFEALACGAQICSYTPALHLFAEEWKDYLTFKNEDELISKIDFLLVKPHRLEEIRKNARKTVEKRHLYTHRTKEIQEFLS